MRISDWSSDVCSSDLVSIPRTTSSEGSVSASAGRVMAPDLTLSGSDWLCFPERPPERPPVGGFLSMPHALKLGALSAKPLLRLGTRGSPLALAQAEEVRRRLAAAHPHLAAQREVAHLPIKTPAPRPPA